MSFTLTDLTAAVRTIGRASIFYTAVKWVGTTDLVDLMVHLGDTEGEVGIEMNDEYSDLTLPELTGPSIHERFYGGANPVISLPLYLADPAIRAIVNPAGGAPGTGFQRRQSVTEHSLVIVPEPLMIEANAQVAVDYTTAGGWTVGGDAATSAQDTLVNQMIYLWRGHFTFPPLTYRHADAGKAVDTVFFQVMFADIATSYIPDGNRLFYIGDPVDASIDIHPSG